MAPRTYSVECRACKWWCEASAKIGSQIQCGSCKQNVTPCQSQIASSSARRAMEAEISSQAKIQRNHSDSRQATIQALQQQATPSATTARSSRRQRRHALRQAALKRCPDQLLRKLQQALVLPLDQVYHDVFETQIKDSNKSSNMCRETVGSTNNRLGSSHRSQAAEETQIGGRSGSAHSTGATTRLRD